MFIYVERGGSIHQIECFSDDDRAGCLQGGGVDVTEAFATEVDLPDFQAREGVASALAVVARWRAPAPVETPVSTPAPEPVIEAPKPAPPAFVRRMDAPRRPR